MKTLRFASMLLMTVTLAFGVSSCGGDDDEEEPLPGGDWGQVDGEDEPGSGGGDGTATDLTGYWAYMSPNGDKAESMSFTSDGDISYAGFIEDGDAGSYVVWAEGTYEVVGDGKILAEYGDVYVHNYVGENVYNGFTDGEGTTKVYDIVTSGNGTEQHIMLLDGGDHVLNLTKESRHSFVEMLTGGWYNVGQTSYTNELISFSDDGMVTYEHYVFGDEKVIIAKGSYTVTEDLRIIADYSDISVSTQDGSGNYNGFINGYRRTVEYDLMRMDAPSYDGVITLRDDDGNIIEIERYVGDGHSSAVSGNIVGTWTISENSSSGGRTVVEVEFRSNGQGTYTTAYYDYLGYVTWSSEVNFEYTYGVLHGMSWGSLENGILEVTMQDGDDAPIAGRWRVDFERSPDNLTMDKIGAEEHMSFNRE